MKFEILLSTMFRTDLGFLDTIFKNNKLDELHILIINQTDENKKLKSNSSNIRVINSLERGVSQSKNLALRNALGEICFLADDDIIYKPNLRDTVVKEFTKYPKAYMVYFETTCNKGIPHSNYPPKGLIKKKDFPMMHMIGMAVRKQIILSNNLFFNNYFSYGGKFGSGDEHVFLTNAHHKGFKAYNSAIVMIEHPNYSSGKNIASDINIHAYSARMNHYYGTLLANLFLIKYLFFLYRKKFVSINSIFSKYKIGRKGISDYNDLINKKLIKRQHK